MKHLKHLAESNPLDTRPVDLFTESIAQLAALAKLRSVLSAGNLTNSDPEALDAFHFELATRVS